MTEEKNRRILIVDDNEDIHTDFLKILGNSVADEALTDARSAFLGNTTPQSSNGPVFELMSAFQGEEGHRHLKEALAEERPFALAFVDVRMPPGWDGIQTIKQFWDEDEDLQVVICTAFADYSFEEIVAVLGSTDRLLILKKPFDPVEVRQLAVALTEKWNVTRRDRQLMRDLRQAELEARENATRLEAVNKDLEEANRRAEAASKAKSEFLANMSHEIRTPMTGILGYGDLLCDAKVPLEDRLKYGDVIRRCGDHLLTILNDILDISKIESGSMELSITQFAPSQLVEEVYELMRTQSEEKGLSFDLEFKGPIPRYLKTDIHRVRQVLLNLVGNAIKFTEEGSVKIVVQLEDAEDPSSKQILFSIVDTGIGIDAKDVPTLFEAFSQADTSSTREAGGTGLGLTISRRLALMLGGGIDVDSELGRGSTFTLRLDVGQLGPQDLVECSDRSAERRSSPDRSQSTDLEARILLVEDGPVNQMLISTVLRKSGAEVSVADDGRAGVEMVAKAAAEGQPFDLILMDMQMPVMDGYEATRHLRQEGVKTPIIALTAHAMGGDREKCIEAGCTEYAAKPIDRHSLVELCRRLTSLEKTDAALPSRESVPDPTPAPDEAD
ncbi:MAG: response regulator [Planctomycetota bacterium]|nr:response regulator [Planctomycetota bacterium]